MFQTDLIIALQAIRSNVLSKFFVVVSAFGHETTIIILVVLVLFAANLRKGLILTQCVVIAGALTLVAKEWFALPAPSAIDPAVSLLDQATVVTTLPGARGASAFFERLPVDVVNAIRSNSASAHNYAFPSGHLCLTTAFWISASLLFKRRWLWTIALIMIPLMALSRMYLGHHFLADVLAGVILGLMIIVALYPLMHEHTLNRIQTWLPRYLGPLSLEMVSYLALIAVPALLLPLVWFQADGPKTVGYLFGINAAFALLAYRHELPNDFGTTTKRALRTVLALTLFFLIRWIISSAVSVVIPADTSAREFVRTALIGASFFYVAVKMGRHLKLFATHSV